MSVRPIFHVLHPAALPADPTEAERKLRRRLVMANLERGFGGRGDGR